MAYHGADEKNIKFDETSSEKIDKIDTARDHADQLTELFGIEATAASKAAWLISMVVSLGGLLFGMLALILQQSNQRLILRE